VIGQQLAIDLIEQSIPELVEKRLTNTAETFAVAILTTDLVPKTITTTLELSQGEIRITGIAKGSGMIHPNMATMLGYILSDVKLSKEQAHASLVEAANVSFNMISVDGDTSTNDSCFIMANGTSGVTLATKEDHMKFQHAINEVAKFLAKSIVKDGEGATKLFEIQLLGLDDQEIAKNAARSITVSPLIKSAIHGEDPNWGRVLARLGKEGVKMEHLNNFNLTIQGIKVFAQGAPQIFDRDALRSLLKSETIVMQAQFNAGNASAIAWGCDLSKKYVEINAEYTT
jgi:glutamate N-acetyltransferase/amino-acid N-acetyltransferase